MSFIQNLLTKNTIGQFNYLRVAMDDHQAHFRKLSLPKKTSQLDVIIALEDLLNTKKLAIKQVRISRRLFIVVYDIAKSNARIFQNSDGRYYIHRETIFIKKDANGLLAPLTYDDAKLIAQAGANITDSYNNGMWAILYNNFVDINTGKNIFK